MTDELKEHFEKKEKERKAERFKQFLRKHKWEIIGTAVGTVVGLKMLKRHSSKARKHEAEVIDIFKTSGSRLEPWSKKIDEDIFTDLAPELEQMVLNAGVDKAWIERCYDLDPVTHKLVEINISTIHGD